MKIFILLACNIFLTFLILDYIYDPVKEFSPVNIPVYCIKFEEEEKSLCGQCVSRSAELSPAKGFILDSSSEYVSLKFDQGVSQLSCQESLHLINYHNAMKKSIHFEKMSSITQLLQELGGVSSPRKKGKEVIQLNIESFNVYGWYNLNQRDGVQIKVINEFYSVSVMDIFFNILSILLILLLCIAGTQLLLCKTDFSGCLALLSCIMLQLATLKYTGQWANVAVFLARIAIMALYLMKLRIKGLYIASYSLFGFILASYPLTLAIYSTCGWVLMIIYGQGKKQVRLIWQYLLGAQLISSTNYIYWYFLAKEDSDLVCRLIELSQFLINLAVLMILREDQAITQKGIELKDYDEELYEDAI